MSKATKQFERVAQKKNEEKGKSEDSFDTLPSLEPPTFQLAVNPNTPPSDSGGGGEDGASGSGPESGHDGVRSDGTFKTQMPKAEAPPLTDATRKKTNARIKGLTGNVYGALGIAPAQTKMAPQPFQAKVDPQSPVQMKAGKSSFKGDDSSKGNGGILNKMGQAMGTDFSGVKMVPNSNKATKMGALAYAQGNSVHFAPGQFNPKSKSGQELIGHELAHVKQQREGRVKPTTSRNGSPVNDDKGLESEADRMGAKSRSFQTQCTSQKARKCTQTTQSERTSSKKGRS